MLFVGERVKAVSVLGSWGFNSSNETVLKASLAQDRPSLTK